MKKQVRGYLLALVAIPVLSCTCGLFGPSFSGSTRVGDSITVEYPDDWYAIAGYGGVTIISPDSIDPDSWIDHPRSPYFLITSLDSWIDEDWHRDVSDPETLLSDLAIAFGISVRDVEITEYGDIRWTRGFFSQSIFSSTESFEGWLAVDIQSDNGALILAASNEDDWNELDSVFEAMLRRIEIGD